MGKIWYVLFALLFLAGCRDTGGGVVGYVNSALDRSTLSTAALSISVTEGASHSLLIVLDHGVSRTTTLDWSIAAPNGQFSSTSGTVGMSEGQSSALITLDSLDNNVTDGHRNYVLTISGSSLVFANSITVQVTVIDNESAPLLSVADISVAEGNGAGTTDAVFTVTASNPSTSNIVVNYTTIDGTAINGTDYNAASGTLIIPAGSLTGTITVPVIRDAIYETNTTFSLILSGGSGYTVAGSRLTAVGTIEDDESQSTISLANVSVTEGTGGGPTNAVFTISMASVSAQNVTVNYTTQDGTAVAGTDYTTTSGTATITAGSTSTTITVPVLHNALFELDKTFTLKLSGGSGYLVSGSTLTATGTIVNDDVAPTISIANASVTEGNSGTSTMTFTITASGASGVPITVNYVSSNGTATAGTDYNAANSTATIAVGSTSTTFNITVAGNTIYQNNRSFNITLSGGAGYTAAGSSLSAVGTINDDDLAPTLSISNVTVVEGTGAGTTNAVFTVTASALSDMPITFDYATSDGTAIAGSDYISTSGSATILAGSSTAVITVPITRDSTYEATESFNITLSGGSGYGPAGSILNAIANITDDDTAPTISIGNVTVTEGTGAGTTNAVFTVTLAAVSGQNLSVNYATSNSTAGSADYTSTSGTLTINAGSTTGTITVPVTQDSVHENDETFTVTLSAGSGYKVAGSTLTATGTIEDDDDSPTVSIANVALAEGNSGTSNMTFTVTASAASELPISFNYATSDGTASSSFDYTASSGSKTIAAGSTTTTITVPIIGNTRYENNKTFTVTLSAGSGYTASGSTLSATGTIQNDDTAPTVTISDISLVEGSGAGTTNAIFTVTLSAISGINVTFDYATSNGTATAGSDYTATSGSTSIVAGQTQTTISVPITRDTTFESSETFTMTLSNLTGYTATGSTLSATATITNDDPDTRVWDFQSAGDYTLGSFLNFATGSITLSQVDSNHNTATEFNTGTLSGVTHNGTSLTLNTSTATTMVHAASWTPKYSYLVGYWKFDGNWSDSSASNITLSPTASAVTNPSAIKSGTGAAGFPSGHYASGTLAATYSNYTISVWVNPTTLVAGGGPVGQSGAANPAIFIDSSGNLYWAFGSVTTTVKASAGLWTHLVAVQNGTSQTLYVNGVLAGTATASSSLSAINVGRINATTMAQSVDELAIFNTPLSANDVNVIYARQRSRYNGLYTSPVVDMGTSAPWTSMTPSTPVPFLKELAATNETISPSLMTDLVALYHFNETSVDQYASAADYYDSTGSGNNGSGNLPLNARSNFVRGVTFNGSTNVRLGVGSTVFPPATTTGLTFSAWLTPADVGVSAVSDRRIFSGSKNGTGTIVGLAVGRTQEKITAFYMDGSGVSGAQKELIPTTITVKVDEVVHVVLTISGTKAILYLNGVEAASASDASVVNSTSFSASAPLRVGSIPAGTGNFYSGAMDELALWKRGLSAGEVLEVYRRGANRIRYQVRTCVDVACNCKSINTGGSSADCDGDGVANNLDLSDSYAAEWFGADGTSGSFFSELQNNSSIDSSQNPNGTVKTTNMVYDWSTSFFPTSAHPANNRYFQYRAFMDSDDNSTLCSSGPCLPEITAMLIGPSGRYYGGAPSVVNNTAFTYTEMQSLTRVDPNACTTYQVSTNGGSTWKYYDTVGGSWTATTEGTANSNPLSDYTLSRLQALGSGSFKFKAFLNTNAAFTQSCELNSVTATATVP